MIVVVVFAILAASVLFHLISSSPSAESSDHGIEEGFDAGSDGCYDYY